MHSQRKNLRKGEVSHEGGNVSSRRSEYVIVMAEEVGMQQGRQIEQALEEAPPSNGGYDHHFDRGSAWVMDHIVPMCKRMGLAIEGREMELLAFLASLEANKKVTNQVDDQFDVEEEVGEEDID